MCQNLVIFTFLIEKYEFLRRIQFQSKINILYLNLQSRSINQKGATNITSVQKIAKSDDFLYLFSLINFCPYHIC